MTAVQKDRQTSTEQQSNSAASTPITIHNLVVVDRPLPSVLPSRPAAMGFKDMQE